jgi:hypothetical protein
VSSSKLQPCFELCQFVQALFKVKVARWNAHLLIGISKRPMCIIHRNGWRITQGTQPERRVLNLESRSYNKSYPSPKVYCSKIDDRTPPMLVLKPCLTFLSSVCTLLTSNQVHSLVHIYRRAMLVNLQASTLHVVSPPSSHVVSISPMTSRTILFYLFK